VKAAVVKKVADVEAAKEVADAEATKKTTEAAKAKALSAMRPLLWC
jgi:hypothetical protein